MGFSVSATMAIFLAAFLILFSLLYSSVNDAFDRVSSSFDEKYNDLSDRASTSISFVDVTYTRDFNSLKVRVENTGGTVLRTDETELLVHGVLTTPSTMTIGGSASDIWFPTEVLTISIASPGIQFSSGLEARMHKSTNSRLSSASNITVSDAAYVLDGQSIDVFTLEGTFDFTITDPTHLIHPQDIKAYGDYLYVLDNGTHVDRYSSAGAWIDEFINDSTDTPSPSSIAVDGTYVYLVDGNNHIDRYDESTGAFVDQIIPNGGTMSSPRDVFVGAYIFVTDFLSGSYHIDRYALNGGGGTQVIGPNLLAAPTDISASAAGLDTRCLFVVNNSREVLVFDESGALLDSISDGLGDSVRGVDATGKIFVSDGVNGLVIENFGTSVKVVVENGVSSVTML